MPRFCFLAPDGHPIEGIIALRPFARDLLARVDTIVFDIDGVLLDVSRSIRTVNCLAVPAYLRTLPGWTAPDDLLTSADIEPFKEAGGFNDDWDLTFALVLLYLHKGCLYQTTDAVALHALSPTIAEYTAAIARRGGWLRSAEAVVREKSLPSMFPLEGYDKPRIQQIFQELWAGNYCQRLYGFAPQYFPGEGWIHQDTPLIDTNRIPDGVGLGVVTGRTLAEARLALEMVGLESRIRLPGPRGVTKDDGLYKPEPWGMRQVLTQSGSAVSLYIGDTIDDLRTVLAFRRLPEAAHCTLLSAQVLTGTTPRTIAPTLFAETDILAEDVNAVLRLFANR